MAMTTTKITLIFVVEPITLGRTGTDKNYLFCCFPHGIISAGPFAIFGNIYGEFNDYFPKHNLKLCTLKQNFYMPFFREIVLGLGGCSASEKSIEYLLNDPRGGQAVGLIVGGVAESYYCEPRTYNFFIRETDIFDQYGGKDTKLKNLQEFMRKYVGIAPIISAGRGIFQYSFGMIPYRVPITMLVGQPIEVEKNDNPTLEEVDFLHTYFIKKLCDLFEENKHLYLKDCEDIHIEII
ncbi:hypothetical protein WA026_007344 [Henosepilachna vigintioctopunctata]|uniref:Uncharacterized protein n=1 Tax=Henosepilachna vigintioctopunctata TaxID=420089 RepID=A0AAW1UTN7_9CUCU